VQPAPLPEVRKPTIDPAETARAVQKELARVGCYAGDVNAPWGKPSRDAVALFNRHSGMRLDVSAASGDTLDALKDKSGRVCPLQCRPGFVVSDGRCERKPTEAARKPTDTRKPSESAARPGRDRREAASSQRPTPSAGGGGGGGARIVCGMTGCLEVKQGCRGSTIPSGSGTVAVVSCGN
jgi:hypothetical protein